jgi:predicted ABC-type ATPase
MAAAELADGPLSDADYVNHVHKVIAALDNACVNGLATDERHTIDRRHKVWSPERNSMHGQIIADAYESWADVPPERHAIVAGGLGGSGKTTVLEKYAGIDLSRYVIVNPDDFKAELARRDMTPKIDELSPMETTALAHEESSQLARRLAFRAMADGKNIIWDITMSSPATLSRRLEELCAAGYGQIDGIFIDIPIEVSVTRAEARHRVGHDRYLAGEGLGGRLLLPEIIRRQADPEYGSINRQAFEMSKDQFNSWAIFDNSVDNRPPVLVAAGRGRHAIRPAVGGVGATA